MFFPFSSTQHDEYRLILIVGVKYKYVCHWKSHNLKGYNPSLEEAYQISLFYKRKAIFIYFVVFQ